MSVPTLEPAMKIGDVTVPGRVLMAPMTGVTDLPFRQIASALGAPYVATEMVASDAFARGRPDVVRRAAVGEGLPLTVIQLVGRDPTAMAEGARLAEAAGADIIDLNFGCPAKEVTGVLSGSALMRDLELSSRIIGSVADAVRCPVTVKMRLGWDRASMNAPELAARAEALGAMAISVHGRTRCDFYNGQADWSAVAAVRSAIRIPLIVNGDITDPESARAALAQSGADAVMLGRGVYGQPWLAATLNADLTGGVHTLRGPDAVGRFQIVMDHLSRSICFYGEKHGIRMFRKHLGWYVLNAPWPGDASVRREAKARLCRLESPAEIEAALTRLWLGESTQIAA
ncbi:MAG: tRNA dihydrouridine synthase DusB [Brevundimonas sp.]|jgi:tRNA-dihydrouridine synthase B|uniref:tRNA dihydrouridine synthase DusB n=1 Tax=Brevundimonas sp. TaxID=1871086 RepID=UPI00391C289C